MNIIIACAGSGTRWNNYTGVEKQLVNINGKPLLLRTLEQIKNNLEYNKIYLLVNENNKSNFLIDSITNSCEIVVLSNNSINNVPALYSIKDMLDNKNDILLLLGDVYFTDETFKKIKDNTINNYLSFFGRINNNKNLNTKSDELFGFYFSKNTHNLIKQITNNVKDLFTKKKISRFLQWEILTYYYAFNNTNILGTTEEIQKFKSTFQNRQNLFIESFININDLTDDFDYPQDYDKFIKLIKL